MANGYKPRMRLALAQLDARLGDVEANAERARRAVAEATAAGADVVVFPELYLSGYALRALDPEVARATARTADDVASLLGGPALVGFHEGDADDRRFNSAVLVLDGRVVHVHRKLYLVDYEPFGETQLFAPGRELRAFDSPLGRLATLVCNDAWQPFVPFVAAQDGARVLLVPSCSSTAVPEAEEYWRELTRFHARMLQCFVVFVNRVGREGGLTFWGGSHVNAPDGTTLAEGPRFEEALVYADLDLAHVERRREELPIVGDPRLELLLTELARVGLKDGQAAQ